ncbi:IS66 family transposase [Mesobacillus subterraneus]|nr:IS66 family transposase [Mesobacillus subterraneus]MCM3576533.1 IS66 family transposase [Mesobacillus subterraneus]
MICDGYSAYGKIAGITFANCWILRNNDL